MKHSYMNFRHILLCLCLFTGIKASAYDAQIDGIYYNLYEDKIAEDVWERWAVVTRDRNYSGDVIIPWQVTYDGNTYQVIGIGSDAFYCTDLTSVSIPNSVTYIGSSAFSGCSSLTSVTIGNSVTYIGDWAFSGCSGLTSVSIPNSVTSIGYEAFYYCSNLISVTIPTSVTSIGDSAFSYCSSLTSVTLPNSVTSIGNEAFGECSSLTSVIIPGSVTSIGEGAFRECSSLTSVIIPGSVTSIGDGAFWDCSSLTSITIPESITSIGAGAFLDCSSLLSAYIGGGAIGPYAFYGCYYLTSLFLGEGVTSIGDDAFRDCAILSSVIIPENVTYIGSGAFYYCLIKEVISYIEEPFEIDESVFACRSEGAVLYVPRYSRYAYTKTPAWNSFFKIRARSIPLLDKKKKEQWFAENEKFFDGMNLADIIIDDIYYNIPPEAGGYNAEQGCIEIGKATSDEEVQNIAGMDVEEPEVKRSFCGFILIIPAGEGSLTIDAEATDSMTLKVKIGDDEPIEQSLDGKQQLTIPYSTATSACVYVYAGKLATPASARRKAETQTPDRVLRIYGIALNEETPTEICRPRPKKESDKASRPGIYTLQGVKVADDADASIRTLPSGIYIINGKKTVVK